MKKILAYLTVITLLSQGAVVFADENTWQNTSEVKALLDECKSKGINTEYEEVSYNILNKFVTDYASDVSDGASTEKLEYNNSALTEIYNETIENLNGYLNGTKKAKSKSTEYKTGEYNISGGSLKNASGEVFFSTGYGHTDYVKRDMASLDDFGTNNVQIEEGAKYYIEENDGIAEWKYSKGTVENGSLEIADGVGRNGGKCLKITNQTPNQPNVYMQLYQDVFLEPGSLYTLEFYVKGSNINNFTLTWKDDWSNRQSITGNYSDWTKKTFRITTDSYGATIRFVSDGITDELLLDDFSLTKFGSSENMIKNCGFEEETPYEDFEVYVCNKYSKALRGYLKAAEENNLAVCLNLSPHYFPDFIKTKYPEITGGYGLMNFNIDHTAVKQVLSAYAKAVLEAVGDSPALTGICITNEPTYNIARNTSYFNEGYRNYLKNKYGTVTVLNKKYGTLYSSFDKISMPTAYARTLVYYDWMNYNREFFADWHAWFTDVVRQYTDVPVYSKMIAGYIMNDTWQAADSGSDYVLFAEWGDIMGFDGGGGVNGLAAIDAMTSVTGKPLYNIENHIIADGCDEYNETFAGKVYEQLFQTAMHGLDASTMWVWGRVTDPGNALYGNISNRPDCMQAMAYAGFDLNRNMNVVTAFQEKKKDVALLYSDASNLYDSSYMTDMLGIYEQILYSGLRCGFVNEKAIDKLTDYDTLIINADYVEADTYNAVLSFANAGGRVIFASDNALGYDEFKKSRGVSVNAEKTDKESAASLLDGKISYIPYENGAKAEKVAVESVEYNGDTYLNICNFDEENSHTVLPNDEYRTYYDLISEEETMGAITLEPLGCALLKVGAKTEELQSDIVNAVAGVGISGELLISWINPSLDNIAKADIVGSDGKSVIGTAELNTGKRAVNSFKVTGLTDGTRYTYRIMIYTEDGKLMKEEVCATPGGRGIWQTQNGFQPNYKLIGSGDGLRIDSKIYTYIDSNESHGGNSSLKIVSNYDKTSMARFLNSNWYALEAGKTYTLSLWAKTENLGIASGEFHADRDSVQIVSDWNTLAHLGYSGDGWKQYKVTPSGGQSINPGIFVCTQGTVWIDDIELYANDEPEKNLINNGTFEYDCGMSNLMATAGGTEAIVSWKNPAEGVVTGVKITDKSGRAVNTATEPSLSAGVYASAKISGLEENAEYEYTIVMKLQNAPDISKKVRFTTGIDYFKDAQNGVKMYELSGIYIDNNNLGMSPFNIEITKEAAHGGKYGLRASSNYQNWVNIKFAPVTLDSSKKYRASAFVKSIAGELWLCSGTTGKVLLENTGEWTKYSFDISETSEFTMNLQSARSAFSDLWADDFALYELDSNGNEIGENLIKNGGFEDVFDVEIDAAEKNNTATAGFTAHNHMTGKTLDSVIYIAAYDGKRLVGVERDTLVAETSETKEKSLSLEYGDGCTVKAFAWESDTLSPLCEAEIVAKP